MSRGKAKNQNPQKKRFSLCRVRIEAPPPARFIEGRVPQKMFSSFQKKKWSRANPKSGEHFFAGHASGASGGGVDSFAHRFWKQVLTWYNKYTALRKSELLHFFSMCPRQESDLHQSLRRALLYPLSYGGVETILHKMRQNYSFLFLISLYRKQSFI